MKRTKRMLSVSLLGLLLTAIPAYGDIARPKTSPSPQVVRVGLHTRLTIVPDDKAYDARLQISENSLKSLIAAMENTTANESVAQRISHGSTRTIVAGLFMCLSLSFAGVWLVRSGHTRGSKAVVALLMGSVLISAAAIITSANAGPPGSYYWRKLPQNLTKGAPTDGGVSIEIVRDTDDSRGVKLIIPTKPQ